MTDPVPARPHRELLFPVGTIMGGVAAASSTNDLGFVVAMPAVAAGTIFGSAVSVVWGVFVAGPISNHVARFSPFAGTLVWFLLAFVSLFVVAVPIMAVAESTR